MRRVAFACACITSATALAAGHGPVFGLTTPTLGQGGWQLDVAAMDRLGTAGDRAMLREMLSYGVTPDVQLSLSAPEVLQAGALPPARGTAMMPTSSTVEALAAWRFFRVEPGVGRRIESTLYLGTDIPVHGAPGPGAVGELAAGYASRSWYLWGGAGDQAGAGEPNLFFYSAVVGYRPPFLRVSPPLPDARLFVEALGERGEGFHQLLVGPTTLILWSTFGLSGGVLFPAYRTGSASDLERARAVIDGTWFF